MAPTLPGGIHTAGGNRGFEEAGYADGGHQSGARLVEDLARMIVLHNRTEDQTAGNEIPELAQALDAPLGRIAGNDRGIDGADGNAGDPLGCKPGLAKAAYAPPWYAPKAPPP